MNPNNQFINSDPPPNKYIKDLQKYCQCGEEILNNICTEEQIISGCYDVSKNGKKTWLRNLEEINCTEIDRILFKKENKYSEVFKLRFDVVNQMALGILIVYSCIVLCTILVMIVSFSAMCCGDSTLALLILPCIPYIIIIGLSSGCADFIMLIILMVNYYKGRTTGDFLDYYNTCLKEPEKNKITKIFATLDEIDYNMTIFVILNLIGFSINYVGSCFIKQKKD